MVNVGAIVYKVRKSASPIVKRQGKWHKGPLSGNGGDWTGKGGIRAALNGTYGEVAGVNKNCF